MEIRAALEALGIPFWSDSWTNQLFPILPNEALTALEQDYVFNHTEKMDDTHTAVRICTSWATTEAQTQALIADLRRGPGLST